MQPDQCYSVSEINDHIKAVVESDPVTQHVWITGEISNLRVYQLGKQIYFNLSDGKAQLSCVIFQSFLKNIKFSPENGLKVFALGKITYYNKKGTISFQVIYMSTEGMGKQSQDLEKLKQKLLEEGLFAPERKKPIPLYPKKVGVITALGSAAMQDFITITQKLAPCIQITIIPAVVQGASAPRSIIEALYHSCLPEAGNFDIVLIIRGGGSAEDLAAFNDETIVRAVANYPFPTISAIGHEIDYSLTDFAVDLRTPTPTAAAHQVSSGYQQLFHQIPQLIRQADQSIDFHLQSRKEIAIQSIEIIGDTIVDYMDDIKIKTEHLLTRVELANPILKLKQGYSIVRSEKTKKVIKSIKQVKDQELISIALSDGDINATVSNTINLKLFS